MGTSNWHPSPACKWRNDTAPCVLTFADFVHEIASTQKQVSSESRRIMSKTWLFHIFILNIFFDILQKDCVLFQRIYFVQQHDFKN